MPLKFGRQRSPRLKTDGLLPPSPSLTEPAPAVGSALLVRKDHIFCTRCYDIVGINAGDGTPVAAYMIALQQAAARHPDRPHASPFGNNANI